MPKIPQNAPDFLFFLLFWRSLQISGVNGFPTGAHVYRVPPLTPEILLAVVGREERREICNTQSNNSYMVQSDRYLAGVRRGREK
jgi:hypothetical protein